MLYLIRVVKKKSQGEKEMVIDTRSLAVAYYTALGEKDLEKVRNCLHPDVEFKDPQESILGREKVLEAARGFTTAFESLTIRSQFGSENQAMIVYDVVITGVVQKLFAASLLDFSEGLISRIELFYDTRCFVEK